MFKIFIVLILLKLKFFYFLQAQEIPEIPGNCQYEILNVYDGPPVNKTCIECMCEIFTNCDLKIGCNGYTCGPFRITKSYWEDAGAIKLQLENIDIGNQSFSIDEEYQNCTNDYQCSERIIQNYMGNYGVDCNEDDIIDCYDFALLHYLGKNNCNNALPRYLRTKLTDCLSRENK